MHRQTLHGEKGDDRSVADLGAERRCLGEQGWIGWQETRTLGWTAHAQTISNSSHLHVDTILTRCKAPTMAVKKIFKDTDAVVDAQPTLEALEKPKRAGESERDEDSEDDDDAAPEAVSTSALRQTETQREKDSAAREDA